MKKFDLLLRQIRGLSYHEAITQLKFANRKGARDVSIVLECAKVAAEKKGLNVDRLVVVELFATKGKMLKKIEYKAKGQAGLHRTRYSHLTAKLREAPLIPGKEWRVGKFQRGKRAMKRQHAEAMLNSSISLLDGARQHHQSV